MNLPRKHVLVVDHEADVLRLETGHACGFVLGLHSPRHLLFFDRHIELGATERRQCARFGSLEGWVLGQRAYVGKTLLGPVRPSGHVVVVVVAGHGVPARVVGVGGKTPPELVGLRNTERRCGVDAVGMVGAEEIELGGAEASGWVGWGHFCLVGAWSM